MNKPLAPPIPRSDSFPPTVQESAAVVRRAMEDLQDDALMMLQDFTARTGLLVASITVSHVTHEHRDIPTKQNISRTDYRINITTRLPPTNR